MDIYAEMQVTTTRYTVGLVWGHATQVDYFLVRKGDRASCLDCKVVLGTEMPTQHRLLVLVFRMRKKIVEKKVESKEQIMWGRLKGTWPQLCQPR